MHVLNIIKHKKQTQLDNILMCVCLSYYYCYHVLWALPTNKMYVSCMHIKVTK